MSDFDFVYYSNFKYLKLFSYYMEQNGLSYLGVFFLSDKNLNKVKMLDILPYQYSNKLTKDNCLSIVNPLLYDVDIYTPDTNLNNVDLSYKSINSLFDSHSLESESNLSYVSNLLGINKTIVPMYIEKDILTKDSVVLFAWITYDIISNSLNVHNKFLDIFKLKFYTLSNEFVENNIEYVFKKDLIDKVLNHAEHYSHIIKYHTDTSDLGVIRWI